MEYTVEFTHTATGATSTRTIPGNSPQDIREYAESCCRDGEYTITKYTEVKPVHNCHYCGQRAYKLGFFGEWVCDNCR